MPFVSRKFRPERESAMPPGAVRRARRVGALVEVHLFGYPDPANLGFIPKLVEAAASGGSTDAAGYREVVRDGEEGLLVAAGGYRKRRGRGRRLLPTRTCAIGWEPQRTHAFTSGLPPTPTGRKCGILTSRWRRLHDPR